MADRGIPPPTPLPPKPTAPAAPPRAGAPGEVTPQFDLSAADMERAKANLESVGAWRPCPFCQGRDEPSVHAALFAVAPLKTIDEGAAGIRHGAPFLMLTCRSCGGTRLFAANP